jgi:phage virion morphogenesis protein
MAKILVKINDSTARAKIKALQDAAGDLRPLYATVGRVIVNKIRLCFKLGIDPWGSPWAALKIRKGQPLRDTGRLNRSIVANPDAKGVTIGTNVQGARVHQFGATIEPKKKNGRLVFPGPGGRLIFAKKVTIPARPFMPLKKGFTTAQLPASWSADITNALRAYFKAAAEKAGS